MTSGKKVGGPLTKTKFQEKDAHQIVIIFSAKVT